MCNDECVMVNERHTTTRTNPFVVNELKQKTNASYNYALIIHHYALHIHHYSLTIITQTNRT